MKVGFIGSGAWELAWLLIFYKPATTSQFTIAPALRLRH